MRNRRQRLNFAIEQDIIIKPVHRKNQFNRHDKGQRCTKANPGVQTRASPDSFSGNSDLSLREQAGSIHLENRRNTDTLLVSWDCFGKWQRVISGMGENFGGGAMKEKIGEKKRLRPWGTTCPWLADILLGLREPSCVTQAGAPTYTGRSSLESRIRVDGIRTDSIIDQDFVAQVWIMLVIQLCSPTLVNCTVVVLLLHGVVEPNVRSRQAHEADHILTDLITTAIALRFPSWLLQ